MMRKSVLVLIALAVGALFGLGQRGAPINANNPPPTAWAPLLTCPNVDGSSDGSVGLAGDILGVAFRYQKAPPDPAYHIIYDRNADNYIDLANDILGTAARYQQICPLVDTQVAQATQWALANAPMIEDAAALAAIGFTTHGQNVPGQGVHYANPTNIANPAFDPTAPEGLVYTNGRLAAQLYIVSGNVVGWEEDPYSATPGSCFDSINNNSTPPHGDSVMDSADPDCYQSDPGMNGKTGTPYVPLDDVDIDPLSHNCGSNGCSWAGGEGWHVHYRLCNIHIGTSSGLSVPLPVGSDDADCAALNLSHGCGCGTYNYNYRVGWMGHLWNHLGNANVVPDINSTMNGRFADCFPDTNGWKAYNCPQ